MIRVAAAVQTDDPTVVARAVEAFGRAITGLGLEGVEAALAIETDAEGAA